MTDYDPNAQGGRGYPPPPPPPPGPPPAAEVSPWYRRAWGKFRSWPLWVQILIGVFVLAAAVGPFTEEEEAEPESETTSAEGPTTTEPRTTTTERRTTTTERPTTTTSERPTTTTTTAPPTTTTTAFPTTTTTVDPEFSNARGSAESYLDYSGFSRTGLIGQLEYEGYPTDTATAAIDSLTVDWMAEAVESAQSYLDYSSFSRAGLVEQLVYEGFTQAEAEHGAATAFG